MSNQKAILEDLVQTILELHQYDKLTFGDVYTSNMKLKQIMNEYESEGLAEVDNFPGRELENYSEKHG